MDESGTDEAECHRKVVSGRKVSGAISSLVNATGLQLEYAKVSHETLLMSVHMYSSETMMWKERGLRLGLYRWKTSKVC